MDGVRKGAELLGCYRVIYDKYDELSVRKVALNGLVLGYEYGDRTPCVKISQEEGGYTFTFFNDRVTIKAVRIDGIRNSVRLQDGVLDFSVGSKFSLRGATTVVKTAIKVVQLEDGKIGVNAIREVEFRALGLFPKRRKESISLELERRMPCNEPELDKNFRVIDVDGNINTAFP